jgi:phosphate acetyltransferase
MTQSLMVVATEDGVGKSVVTLGLLDQFERRGARACYFKPVGLKTASGQATRDARFIQEALKIRTPIEQLTAIDSSDVTTAVKNGRYDDVLDRIMEAHGKLAAEYDVLVCEGLDSLRIFPALNSDINIDVAKNIGATILLVTSARGLLAEEVVSAVSIVRSRLEERGAEVYGVIVNRADPKRHTELSDSLRRLLESEKVKLYGVLPDLPALTHIRMRDVVRALKGQVILGEQGLEAPVGGVVVAAMSLENSLHYMENNCLIITPGDREEILLAAAASFACDDVSRPGGVVLTGGFEPRRKVLELAAKLSKGKLPIVRTNEATYPTAIAVNSLRPVMEENQDDKVLAIRDAFEEYVDLNTLLGGKFAPKKAVTTPRRFLRELREKARAQKRTIVLPESEVDRIVKAAAEVRRQDIADVILLGDEGEVRKYASQLGVTLDDHVQIVNPKADCELDDYVKTLVELRKHKGMNEDIARDLMVDRTYFGTMMVHKGRAHAMVSGATTTTQTTLRPAFEFVKCKTGVSSVSSVFFMCLPDRVLVYGDCAVIPKPTVEQLCEIALMSADTAQAFGVEPKVAMLSYSTGVSGAGPEVEFVRRATELVRKARPNLCIEGPIQYDAAIDPGVARTKMPESKVAGQATVFIFPDLNTGNIGYKAVQRSAKAIAIGPILQGLNKPVNDLSRGATITDIVNTVMFTSIMSQAT